MRNTILLVEDRPEDIRLVQLTFQKLGVQNPLHVVSNGEQAIDYLSGTGFYRDRAQWPVPQLVLLDLHLPGISGFEVLSWMRSEPSLSRIPVVVLTSSDNHRDIDEAYHFGATSYLHKTVDVQAFRVMLEDLNNFVLTLHYPSATIEFDSPNLQQRLGE
jgi:CheY-like chemotaxis protein